MPGLICNQILALSNEPAHEIIVLTTQATSEGSSKPEYLRSLPKPSLFAHMKHESRRRVQQKIRHLAPLDGFSHARLKNEFMEDKKYHSLMSWLSPSLL